MKNLAVIDSINKKPMKAETVVQKLMKLDPDMILSGAFHNTNNKVNCVIDNNTVSAVINSIKTLSSPNDIIDIYVEQADDCKECTCGECHCADEVLDDGYNGELENIPDHLFITNDEFDAYPPSVQNNIDRGLNSQVDPKYAIKPLYAGQIERDSDFIDYMTERFRGFAIDFVNHVNETNTIFGLETIKKVDMIIDMKDKK